MCLLLLGLRLCISFFIPKSDIIVANLPVIEREIESSYSKPNYVFNANPKHNLFAFDPNTVSLSQLLELGLKEKTAAIFLKFRSKGFVFTQKKDLKKVYGITDELYNSLEPYILVGTKESSVTLKGNAVERIKNRIELNSADSTSLISINGIGPSFSRRILKYRSLLGGFIKVEQLLEVYGISEEVFKKIQPNVFINASVVTKINLNKDDFRSVNKHPYLSYEITKQIFNARRNEPINAENLKDIINNAELYEKLLPYVAY